MVPLFEDQKLEQSRRFIYEGEGGIVLFLVDERDRVARCFTSYALETAALLKEALLDSRKYEKCNLLPKLCVSSCQPLS